MAEKIELLEPAWANEEVRYLFEDLQQRIADTMAVPLWMLPDPRRIDDHRRRAYEATEVMRKEAVRLYSLYTKPRILLSDDQ